ncbi:hypothetical protein BT63DRAFT_78894 [Microthyrium microscopicum]|uniref:Uncharacterized protein n=1 Tax=Microthyrium microscopicum TaxID=703497 RepID=A0A6A6TZZ2_9PEZI|nr:hypothetical protein BT63DRAFT_78894 [Microthyrium microscopicum]
MNFAKHNVVRKRQVAIDDEMDDDSDGELIEDMSELPEKPMTDPATAPWGLPISNTDFQKLKVGYQPKSSDDKWGIYASNLDDGQTTKITIGRGWRGIRHYIFYLKSRESESGMVIESLEWDQNKGVVFISEERGKAEAVVLCRELLKCEFKGLPHHDWTITHEYPEITVVNGQVVPDYQAQKKAHFSKLENNSSSAM